VPDTVSLFGASHHDVVSAVGICHRIVGEGEVFSGQVFRVEVRLKVGWYPASHVKVTSVFRHQHTVVGNSIDFLIAGAYQLVNFGTIQDDAFVLIPCDKVVGTIYLCAAHDIE
jgi:hypothetical protein